MPTAWNRSPEEFHKIYLANTDAFYRAGGAGLAEELDRFMTRCALSLWSRAGGISQHHVDLANQIYSKGRPHPQWLLWNLTSAARRTCSCRRPSSGSWRSGMPGAARRPPAPLSGCSPTFSCAWPPRMTT